MFQSLKTNASRSVVLPVGLWWSAVACVAVATPRDGWAAGRVGDTNDGGSTVLVEFDEEAAIRLNQPLVVLIDDRQVGRVVVIGMSSKGRTGKARLAEGVAPAGAKLLTVSEFEASLTESSSVRPVSRSGAWMVQVQGGFGLEMGSELLQGGWGAALSLASRDRGNSGWEIRVSSLSSAVRGDLTRQTNLGPLTETYDESMTIRPLTLGWSWNLGNDISLGAAAGMAQFTAASGGTSFYPAGAMSVSYERPVSSSWFFTAGFRPTYVHVSGTPLFSKAILLESGFGLGLRF
jgi:hypothetical protein